MEKKGTYKDYWGIEKFYKIEGKTLVISECEDFCKPLSFTISEHFPLGYEVWNIGSLPLNFVPLCQRDRSSENPYKIRTDTLVAVKVKESEKLMRAAGYGATSVSKAKKLLARKKCLGRKYISAALPFLSQLEGQ